MAKPLDAAKKNSEIKISFLIWSLYFYKKIYYKIKLTYSLKSKT